MGTREPEENSLGLLSLVLVLVGILVLGLGIANC